MEPVLPLTCCAWPVCWIGIAGTALQVDKIELPPIPSGEYIKKELAQLMRLIEYRPGVMAEALAQRQNIEIYFQGLLAYNGASHPNTYRLVEIAQRVGQFQAMYYKWEYQRPRPGQLCPALMPPIDVPGHAAYPSGHATGAYLIAYCLREVMPKVAGSPASSNDQEGTPLLRLAQRIARNREVLGLHYPSDTAAGIVLAGQTFKLLMECKEVKILKKRAQDEWTVPKDPA